MKTVQTTDERVKEAAAACPTAKATLKTLFPEVFKEEFSILQKITLEKCGDFTAVKVNGWYILEIYNTGEIRRVACVPQDIGFKVDSVGRVIIT